MLEGQESYNKVKRSNQAVNLLQFWTIN